MLTNNYVKFKREDGVRRYYKRPAWLEKKGWYDVIKLLAKDDFNHYDKGTESVAEKAQNLRDFVTDGWVTCRAYEINRELNIDATGHIITKPSFEAFDRDKPAPEVLKENDATKLHLIDVKLTEYRPNEDREGTQVTFRAGDCATDAFLRQNSVRFTVAQKHCPNGTTSDACGVSIFYIINPATKRKNFVEARRDRNGMYRFAVRGEWGKNIVLANMPFDGVYHDDVDDEA